MTSGTTSPPRPFLFAVDPGTNFGWVVRRKKEILEVGLWDLTPKKNDGPGARYLALEKRLEHKLENPEDWVVAYEQVRGHKGTYAAQVYGGLFATLAMFCDNERIPLIPITPQRAKKKATGKAVANKFEMLAAAIARWPELGIVDPNIADALWISECAVADL